MKIIFWTQGSVVLSIALLTWLGGLFLLKKRMSTPSTFFLLPLLFLTVGWLSNITPLAPRVDWIEAPNTGPDLGKLARLVSDALCSSRNRARYCCCPRALSSPSHGLFWASPCFWNVSFKPPSCHRNTVIKKEMIKKNHCRILREFLT